MLDVLNKSYPFNDDLKHNAKIIFFTSIGIFAFLILFQPFGLNLMHLKTKYYLIAGLSVITFLSLSLNLLVIPSLLPAKFNSAKWNIRKEILWNLWMLFTILAGYFLFTNFMGIMQFGFNTIVKLILTAIVPLSILIVVKHNRMLRTHSKLADELSRKLIENKSIQEKIVYFNSDYQKDSLALKVSLILFVRSANNYIEVFWKEGENVKNQMVRCTIANAENVLQEYKFIFKCHRSYLVNINYIQRIEGSSQGYRLFFEKVNFPIPVSKNFVPRLKELI